MIKNILRIFLFLTILLVIFSCDKTNNKSKSTSNKVEKKEQKKSVFSELNQSIFEIKTYDGSRILETGKAFLLTNNTVVAPFSLFSGGAKKATITQINGGQKIEINQFFSYDRINNIILLKVDSINANPLRLYGGSKKMGIKTTIIGKKRNNTQPLYAGSFLEEVIIEGKKLYNVSNNVSKRNWGAPIFVSNGTVLGMAISQEVMYEQKYFAVPVDEILKLLSKKKEAQAIATLGFPNAKRNSSIKHITLTTDFGNIIIRLFNETPAYRDNFIKLAEEGFYDSLLIHRVISDFGIQSGAADTRHAKHDDIVGWKGPGYTIPAHIIPGVYHKRGAIGSPRKPDDKNKQRRSDGSQFYIVTGRKYFDEELDEFEEKNGIKFTSEQRDFYKNIGGSPHLDGSYTVFGEVLSGLDVADRISKLPVKGDFRPISDIRIKKVLIAY